MADLVVDSSVAIKWSVSEPLVSEATAILSAYQAGTVTLLAPDLIYAELGNIIWKKQMLHGLVTADAQQIIDDIWACGSRRRPPRSCSPMDTASPSRTGALSTMHYISRSACGAGVLLSRLMSDW